MNDVDYCENIIMSIHDAEEYECPYCKKGIMGWTGEERGFNPVVYIYV